MDKNVTVNKDMSIYRVKKQGGSHNSVPVDVPVNFVFVAVQSKLELIQ